MSLKELKSIRESSCPNTKRDDLIILLTANTCPTVKNSQRGEKNPITAKDFLYMVSCSVSLILHREKNKATSLEAVLASVAYYNDADWPDHDKRLENLSASALVLNNVAKESCPLS